MMRSFFVGVFAALITCVAPGAKAQVATAAPPATVARAPATIGPVLTARTIDLAPIPSRIEHGVVSVRNTGNTVSLPSVVTVNCHLPGRQGGCPELPRGALAAYTHAAFPNRLVVQVPAIQPGHVYNHNLTFWGAYALPTGTYEFEFVADASATNNESNEGNNAGSHSWVKP